MKTILLHLVTGIVLCWLSSCIASPNPNASQPSGAKWSYGMKSNENDYDLEDAFEYWIMKKINQTWPNSIPSLRQPTPYNQPPTSQQAAIWDTIFDELITQGRNNSRCTSTQVSDQPSRSDRYTTKRVTDTPKSSKRRAKETKSKAQTPVSSSGRSEPTSYPETPMRPGDRGRTTGAESAENWNAIRNEWLNTRTSDARNHFTPNHAMSSGRFQQTSAHYPWWIYFDDDMYDTDDEEDDALEDELEAKYERMRRLQRGRGRQFY
ncbi:unnamed protein product [Calicophoron daubneyi]|uniref:Uncharacterized protein n=1 Tax=Calicophoron daubneyi TaxID=300641 RepID=A0AAV2TF76_CALDB